jgi:hypothetical protein
VLGGTCGTHGRGKKSVQDFSGKAGRKSDDRGLDGRKGLEWILGRQAEGTNWIHPAQDRDWWQAVVKAVMNLRVLAPRI